MPEGPFHEKTIGVYTPATAKQILEHVRFMQRTGFKPEVGAKVPSNPNQKDPLYFKNISDEDMPRYACMQIVGTREIEGQNYLLADKPRDTSGVQGPFLWNLSTPVERDSFGVATAGPHVVVRYQDGLSTAAGTKYGPVVNSWEMGFTTQLVNVAGPTLLVPEGDGHVVRAVVQHGPSAQLIAFDTGGYCQITNDPVYFVVTIDRIGNDEGPSSQPHDAVSFPPDYKLVYRGFSHDRMTGGNAYNVHTWIYRVCDDSFDMNVYIDSNAMIDWIDSLPENVGDPNDSWELFTSAGPQFCGFNLLIPDETGSRGAIQAKADLCLQQNNLYDQVTLVPIPDDWDDCNRNECDDRDPALNVIGREMRVKVTERTCGLERVAMEDDNGYVTVRDTLGSFMYGRTDEELNCRRGVATLVETPGEYECHWMIIWLDLFEEIQVVHDIIIGTRGIEIERKKIDVWRHCDMDDEYIEGNTCETS